MSDFWESSLEPGYYDIVLHDGIKRGKGIQTNWHRETLLHCQKYIEKTHKHLDYACGPGTLIGKFSQADSIGVDIAEKQIDYAKKKYSKKGLFLTTKEFEFNEYKETFDIVTMLGLIEFLTDDEIEALFKKIYTSLKPGGTLIITTPNFNSFIYNLAEKLRLVNWGGKHKNKFNTARIEELFKNSPLKIVKQTKVLSYGILLSVISLKIGSLFNKIFEKGLLNTQGFLIVVELRKENP